MVVARGGSVQRTRHEAGPFLQCLKLEDKKRAEDRLREPVCFLS